LPRYCENRSPPAPALLVVVAVAITWIVDNSDDDKALEARLQQAREAAEAANRAKDIFMANMSHEQRTPLGSVLGFAQILALDAGLGERQREQAQGTRRGSKRLLGLIAELLDLASIEAGRVGLAPELWSTTSWLQRPSDQARDALGLAQDAGILAPIALGVPRRSSN